MHKKALTVAIAGALAVPMAAQAVDFTVSGHVNRALVVTDAEDMSSTTASVKDNGSSGTRVRFTGSSEMMEGASAGVNLEYGAGSTMSLRYGEAWYSGGFGKVTIGQGDQGGEGSVYSDKSGVFGIGQGQEKGTSTLRDYFGSLDGGGGRNERIRYDTPAFNGVSAAFSVGNGDQVSAGLKFNQDFGGTAFTAKIGTLQMPGKPSTISGSVGLKMASGVTISGAWGRGNDSMGTPILGIAEIPAMPAMFRYVDTATSMEVSLVEADGGTADAANTTFENARDSLQTIIDAGNAEDANSAQKEAGMKASAQLMTLFDTFECDPAPVTTAGTTIGDAMTENCSQRLYKHATPGKAGTPEMMTVTDPSYFQGTIGYVFGNTSVAASWWQTSDFMMKGSEGTALGIGVNHNLPKVGAQVYAAVQNYSVEPMAGAESMDETVAVVGTRIKF